MARQQFGTITAIVVVGATLLNPLILVSHFEIMTESISYSVLIFIIIYAIKALTEARPVRDLIVLSALVGLACALRPSSLAFIAALLIVSCTIAVRLPHSRLRAALATTFPLAFLAGATLLAGYVVHGPNLTSLAPNHLFAKSALIEAPSQPADLSAGEQAIWNAAEVKGRAIRGMLNSAPSASLHSAILRRYESTLQHALLKAEILPLAQRYAGAQNTARGLITKAAERRVFSAPGNYLKLAWWEYVGLWMPLSGTIYADKEREFFGSYRITSGGSGVPATAQRISVGPSTATLKTRLLHGFGAILYSCLFLLSGVLLALPLLIWMVPVSIQWTDRCAAAAFASLVQGSMILNALTGTITARYFWLLLPAILVSLLFAFQIARSWLAQSETYEAARERWSRRAAS